MTVDALQPTFEFANRVREGHSQELFMGTRVIGTKGSHIDERDMYFWRPEFLCFPRFSELRQCLVAELHDNGSACDKRLASTLAKIFDIFKWKHNQHDVKDNCGRYFVCRRAKIRPLIRGHCSISTHFLYHFDLGTHLALIT
jgi:hypothetical protein